MADLNIRDFPLDVLAEAKAVTAFRRMSLKKLVIESVREYCIRELTAIAEPINKATHAVEHAKGCKCGICASR